MRSAPPAPRALAQSPLAIALLLALSTPAFAADDGVVAEERAKTLDGITVVGQRYLPDYSARKTRSATKTGTPLLDVPQAVTVVTDKLIADQAMTGLTDTLRYMPGVGVAQGEGNRDTPVMRGNSTTGDFFVDGVRDDVQYIRDTYNVERVEALKGPNAMIFGRGGTGGVINRVTRQADGASHRSGTVQVGSGNRSRGTLDFGTGIGDGGNNAGFRINALYEDSESFRDGYELKRYGINPTFGTDLGADTRLSLSYERFHDERVADRGVPSLNGRPLDVDPSTFFGNAGQSPVEATVDAFDAVIEHDFGNDLQLRNHLRYADYDKFYQNVFAGAVDASAQTVSIAAYNNATTRKNLFNQTDLVWKTSAGGMQHTMLAGVEFGRQETDNLRMTGYFGAPGSSSTSIHVPLADPASTTPVEFRPSATDASNHGVAKIAAVYLQDQIELSPRAGLVFKPIENVSLYASYSKAYQPRAGDQLSSLSASNAALDPETFRSRELGAKWDIRPELQASISVYRLDRGNVAVTDPADATRMILVDGQTAKGVELGVAGRITEAWQVMGGYAYQTGEITSTQSSAAVAGNRLAQLPKHSASLWNRYDFNQSFGVGLGIIHRGGIFANVDNAVTLPAFTRFDAAVYWTLSPALQLQLNIENLGDKRYFASAHSNNNISPGAPRSAWLSLNYRY